MTEISSLQQAREAAGLSLEQISALTNIRPGVIKDLENNSVELCGGIAYARGHIRSIVSAINQKTPKSFKVDADLLVAQMEAAQSEDGRKIIDRLAENNIAINNVSAVNSEVMPVKATNQVSAQEGTNTSTGVNLVVTGVSGKSWLGLTNADGEQVFNGQISAGQVATFSDPQLIKAIIGNAGAVRLNLNGADLGVAGADGEVVRLDFDANGQL
jgi:cytoskeleton protein RodZ